MAGGVGTARGGTLLAPRGHCSLQAAPFFKSGPNMVKRRGVGMGTGKEVSRMRLSPEKGAIFLFSPKCLFNCFFSLFLNILISN